ncbi:MAG: HAD-IIIC family phosphatase [Flavobacterium sp. JAD_PAG50586_2]|nr:MAG: HAD-IIIC family phosphatase [Flavobacterium sp. JAD_PAG50586_2]
MKKDFSGLKPIKVSVLGDTSTQFLTQALRGTGFDFGFDLQISEGDFNQIEQQVFDRNSDLYSHNPEIIIVFQSAHKFLEKYNKSHALLINSLAKSELDDIIALINTIQKQSSAKVIFYNYTEINDSVYGNFSSSTESSFLFQLRKLNYLLMEYAIENNNFHIVDLSTIQNQIGKSNFFKPSIYVNSEMVLSIDALPMIAKNTLDTIAAINGTFKKCLILDLDNTTWGGIIGDDGIENIQIGNLGIGKAFTEFQYWIKKLKNRGIIIAVCSKNTESIAKEPFEKHPDMVLKLDDISVFIANWDSKVSNIQKIQSILNIGFDSMVFLDDNPFERNIVRENIPQITIPELPEDPAEYLEYLYALNLFETVSVTDEDKERTKLYQQNAQRNLTQLEFTNESDFLKSLNMRSNVDSFNKFNIPRVAQLSQRSNQFNLRTVRYSEIDIQNISQSPDYFTFAFTLEDKFGDNGLISVVILNQKEKALFIDTWFMSCRVLKRGMEQFILNSIVDFAKENEFKSIIGEYIMTPKNEIVKDHYENLGFYFEDGVWKLETENYKKLETSIVKSN